MCVLAGENVNEKGLGLREGLGRPFGRKEGNGDSKTQLVEIWRMPSCLTGSRLMTIRGIRGQKTLGAMRMCVCAYVLIGLSVCLRCRQNMKDGNTAGGFGGGWLTAVVWLEASPALHRDLF